MSNGIAFVNITIHFQELHYHQWYHPLNQSGCWTMMNLTFLKQSPVTVNMILRSSFVTLPSSRELKGKRPSSFCHRQDEGKTGAKSDKHTLCRSQSSNMLFLRGINRFSSYCDSSHPYPVLDAECLNMSLENQDNFDDLTKRNPSNVIDNFADKLYLDKKMLRYC